MYELGSSPRKFKFVFSLGNPILSSFVINQPCVRYIAKPHLVSAPRPGNGRLISLGGRHEAAQSLVLGRAVPLKPLTTVRGGQSPDLVVVVEAGNVLPHGLRADGELANLSPVPPAGARVASLLPRVLVRGQIGVVGSGADVEIVAHSAVVADDAEASGRGRWGRRDGGRR